MQRENKMVILGLGSNMGDRLQHLRQALYDMKKMKGLTVKQISPVYISDALLPDNAPADWDHPYLNIALRCETTRDAADLLTTLKNIEWSIGRKPEIRHWGPRVIDIDILALADEVIQSESLTVPHFSLQERPFALWPLADVAPNWTFPLPGPYFNKTAAEIVEKWGSRFSGNAPFRTRQIYQRIEAPQLAGILNLTPDSFSDGGEFINPHQALQHVRHLIHTGAEIIDIGAESTAPHAPAVDVKTEWERLHPVLSEIKNNQKQFIVPPKISIDTRHVWVAEKALEMGADWINDVTGLENKAMQSLIGKSKKDCVMMHHTSIPASRSHVLPRHHDNVKIIYDWAEKRLHELEQAGIERSRIIFDPGVGFGKTAEHSLLIVKKIHVFKNLGVRILIGHSRKSFLSLFNNVPACERDVETTAMSVYLANMRVDYLRVHNVEMCARAIKIMSAL